MEMGNPVASSTSSIGSNHRSRQNQLPDPHRFDEDLSWEAENEPADHASRDSDRVVDGRRTSAGQWLSFRESGNKFESGDVWQAQELMLFGAHCHDLSLDEFKQRFLNQGIAPDDENLRRLLGCLPHSYADWILEVVRPDSIAAFANKCGYSSAKFYQALARLLEYTAKEPSGQPKKSESGSQFQQATAAMVEAAIWDTDNKTNEAVNDEARNTKKRARFAEEVQMFAPTEQRSDSTTTKLKPESVASAELNDNAPKARKAIKWLIFMIMDAVVGVEENIIRFEEYDVRLKLRLAGTSTSNITTVNAGAILFGNNYRGTSSPAPLVNFECKPDNNSSLFSQLNLWGQILSQKVATMQTRYKFLKSKEMLFDNHRSSETIVTIACHGRHAHVTCALVSGEYLLNLKEDKLRDKGVEINLYRSPHFRLDKKESLHHFVTLVYQIIRQIVHEIKFERRRA